MTADAMLSIFQNVYSCSNIDSSQTKSTWRKKYTSRVVLRKCFIRAGRSTLKVREPDQAENVSFSAFYTYKPYYMSKPTEKEKESCLCIDCLNPHLLLKSINVYRKSIDLQEYQSLTTYLNELKVDGHNDELFPETNGEKQVCYYAYERKIRSYKGKDSNDVQYTRTARVDKKDKVTKLLQNTARYLKHRSYVDNVSRVLPMLKDGFNGKYIELYFSEYLALQPKHEAQSAHFSGRHNTLHCAIFRPGDTNFHYHLSDDTKYDPIFVDEVLHDLIHHYAIINEDIRIQSDNTAT